MATEKQLRASYKKLWRRYKLLRKAIYEANELKLIESPKEYADGFWKPLSEFEKVTIP